MACDVEAIAPLVGGAPDGARVAVGLEGKNGVRIYDWLSGKELFVDSNSPHPTEKFGCTICHGGQGSATDFTLAAHTPNDRKVKHEWEHALGWESSHFWDYPMLPKRFVESSCLKCHGYHIASQQKMGAPPAEPRP